MTINTLELGTGTIILYRQYNMFKTLWYKLRKKELPYNKAELWLHKACFSWINECPDVEIYEPKKSYSTKEAVLLSGEVEDMGLIADILRGKPHTIANVINKIRPNTLPKNCTIDDITNCSYYKKVNADQKATKVCYRAKP